VGGAFDSINNVHANNVACWNDTAWSALGTGINIILDGVYSMAGDGNGLYVGGSFSMAGGNPVNNIAKWNGTTWSALGSGLNYGVQINGLCVYNGNVYAGGPFDSAGGQPENYIAEWGSPEGINELSPSNNLVTVYPNPSNGIFTIEQSAEKQSGVIEVYNVLGEKVFKSSFSAPRFTLDLSGQPAGIYLYRLITQEGKLISTGKLIKE